MLRAIVFDFDGVILESADVKTDAFCALYAAHGADVVAKVRAHHLENLGVSRFKKFEWIEANVFGRTLSSHDSQQLGEQFTALALEKVLAAPFVPGIADAMPGLADRYACFVASGTPHAELGLIVERRGLTRWFREVHGTPREKPEIVHDLIARHALAPNEILFIGDGLTDYKAAMAVGTHFLARDTPALHDEWTRLGVRRQPDMRGLAEVVATW
ncbi:MAG: HAD hydrolase-like protein [Myxococcota bacterium]|nr:HAD hydrolase-like protein [Myxococcota bacterium]